MPVLARFDAFYGVGPVVITMNVTARKVTFQISTYPRQMSSGNSDESSAVTPNRSIIAQNNLLTIVQQGFSEARVAVGSAGSAIPELLSH